MICKNEVSNFNFFFAVSKMIFQKMKLNFHFKKNWKKIQEWKDGGGRDLFK